jgi:hypothetical protein
MTEHKHPEAFPEHLRPYLLPVPETRWEALFLVRGFGDLASQFRNERHDTDSEG